MPKTYAAFFFLVAIVLIAVGFISRPGPVLADCGSSASSCKDCHEVKKQAPVNSKGEWHTGHAFGDFCEFCHSGNVKGKEKEAAHTGLTYPLTDVKASCQSCHPNDYTERSQKYASILGKPIGTGGNDGGSGTGAAALAVAAPTDGTGGCGPSVGGGGGGGGSGQIIDLNKVYAETSAPPGNAGNLIVMGLIALVALSLGGLVWFYERPLQRAVLGIRRLLETPVLMPAIAGGSDVPGSFAGRPELSRLLPLLASSDRDTVRALTHLLTDAENGPRIIQATGHLDISTLASLGEGDEEALEALLALVKEMKR